MATMTKASKAKSTPRAPAGKCGLTLRINGESYRVRPIPVDFGGESSACL